MYMTGQHSFLCPGWDRDTAIEGVPTYVTIKTIHEYPEYLLQVCGSALFWSDPTFHFHADPESRSRPYPKLVSHMLDNQNSLKISYQCLFYISRQRHRRFNFQYFGQYIEIFWIKNSLALHLFKLIWILIRRSDWSGMDLAPDPQHFQLLYCSWIAWGMHAAAWLFFF
jgi:hypothetical protein